MFIFYRESKELCSTPQKRLHLKLRLKLRFVFFQRYQQLHLKCIFETIKYHIFLCMLSLMSFIVINFKLTHLIDIFRIQVEVRVLQINEKSINYYRNMYWFNKVFYIGNYYRNKLDIAAQFLKNLLIHKFLNLRLGALMLKRVLELREITFGFKQNSKIFIIYSLKFQALSKTIVFSYNLKEKIFYQNYNLR